MSSADRALFIASTAVSRETVERLDAFAELLIKWSRRINLVAPASVPHLWSRHFLDGAQLWPLLPHGASALADLGSGAGFPGLVIAAIAAERRPGLLVTLVDSDGRKCVFLREAARIMGLTIVVLNQRLELPPPQRFDIVTARALAPLPKLFALVTHWLAPSGRALLLKGADAERELTEAERHWHSVVERIPSVVDASGVILSVTELRRA